MHFSRYAQILLSRFVCGGILSISLSQWDPPSFAGFKCIFNGVLVLERKVFLRSCVTNMISRILFLVYELSSKSRQRLSATIFSHKLTTPRNEGHNYSGYQSHAPSNDFFHISKTTFWWTSIKCIHDNNGERSFQCQFSEYPSCSFISYLTRR